MAIILYKISIAFPLEFIFLDLFICATGHCNSHLCSFTNIEEVVYCYYPGHMAQDELTMLVEYFFDSICVFLIRGLR